VQACSNKENKGSGEQRVKGAQGGKAVREQGGQGGKGGQRWAEGGKGAEGGRGGQRGQRGKRGHKGAMEAPGIPCCRRPRSPQARSCGWSACRDTGLSLSFLSLLPSSFLYPRSWQKRVTLERKEGFWLGGGGVGGIRGG
jgi:hypothetical protein